MEVMGSAFPRRRGLVKSWKTRRGLAMGTPPEDNEHSGWFSALSFSRIPWRACPNTGGRPHLRAHRACSGSSQKVTVAGVGLSKHRGDDAELLCGAYGVCVFAWASLNVCARRKGGGGERVCSVASLLTSGL